MRFKIGKQRLLYLAFGVAAFLIAYSAGAAVPMSDEEAEELKEQFSEQIAGIDQFGIFVNNIRIAFGMFIPALGVGLGVFSGFATGSVFSALAGSSPALSQVPPLLIFFTPFGAMELFTYGLAMSRSGMLIYHFVKKRPWRDYAAPTLIELGIAAAVLFAAALIEWWFIEQMGGLDTSVIIEPV
ncbi:MAG TPA: stage II sporulation protein M [Nitrososphaera sp.]|nr:stage II sporulation protein M [Nitrososphaera sp.]